MKTERSRLERVCQAVALLASLGFAWAAFWELGDSFGAGHFASSSAVCTGAENMWQWHTFGAVPHQLYQAPAPADFYCHHPWGIFWVSALFMKVLGHHAWACRLPAALQSALTVPALYLAGRALWSPVAGAVAALSFAVVPIALSYADFNSLEVPVIFGLVLAIWGYARFRQTYRKRFAALALGSLFYALCCDWAALIFAAGWLGLIFVSVLLLRRWTAPADRRCMATFWGLGVAACAVALGAHLYVFAQLGQLNELFLQGNLRSTGSDLPLAFVLAARKFWIEVSFTGLAIGLGKLALPVLALRTLWRRTELEALPLLVFAMATFQYVVFKQGADVHVFWPHYFAPYFALACAGLAESVRELVSRLTPRFQRIPAAFPGYLGLGLGVLVSVLVLPDGLRALRYAHRSGGRFNENGHPIKPDKDKVAALEWLSAGMAEGTAVILHAGMKQSLWVDWSLRRAVTSVAALPEGRGSARDRYYVADSRFMSNAEQERLAERFALTVVGPYLALDRAEAQRPLNAFSVQRVEPSLLESYWVSSSHALRDVLADPFATWEWRDRFGISPNEPPSAEPRTFEAVRIAHNIAVSRGDGATAQRWLGRLLEGCDRAHATTFSDGNQLLGTRLEHGASLVLSAYFRAAGPDPTDPELMVHSVVERAPATSLVDQDVLTADVTMPFAIHASRWQRGYVYASITEVIRRIGSERWYASFRAPRERHAEFELLRLE
jgi:4-amino-4-deoxy-L-arabinose transferase-like glycosyltransferase